MSHASSSPSSPASEDQLPSPRAYSTLEHCSTNADSAGAIQYHESEQCSSGSDVLPSFSPQFSIGANERTGVVFDNSTLQKW